jgi:hypothetical protein
MHVHPPPINLGAADLYAAQAAQKAAEANKAAEIRRKLLRASASIDGEYSEFVSFSIDERSGDGSSQNDGDQEPSFNTPSARSTKQNKSVVGIQADPLSIWA